MHFAGRQNVMVCVKRFQTFRPFRHLETHRHFIWVSRPAEPLTGHILIVDIWFFGRQPISSANVLELDLPATPSELSFEGLSISVYFAVG